VTGGCKRQGGDWARGGGLNQNVKLKMKNVIQKMKRKERN
jgi:hypothetical protein